ncbi:MAG: hypothetical protein ACP5FH_12210, partial [Terracidiphilus sp.]
MSESEFTSSTPGETPAPATAGSPPAGPAPQDPSGELRPSRLRRFFFRHLPLSVAGGVVLLAALLTGLYFWASSASFEDFVRARMVHALESATGGRVEIASFHWNLLHLEAEADGLVLHGREAAGEAPYAQIGRLRAQISILGFWSPRIRLNDLVIFRPQLHLIVYPDGSTNQPQPRHPRKPGEPA